MTQASSAPRPPALSGTPTTPSPTRRIVGALRIVMGLLVLAAIVTQITDQLVNDAFEPTKYFAYFTVQSSLMNIVVLLVAGVIALRRPFDTPLLTGVRLAIVSYAVVTGVVYAALLRNVPTTGFYGIPWPNEIVHVVAPIAIALDWILAPGRARARFGWLWFVVIYPLAWVAFALVRAAVDGWYPYPFLDPNTAGWPSVGVYIVGIAGFIVVVATVAIVVTRLRRSDHAANGSGAADQTKRIPL